MNEWEVSVIPENKKNKKLVLLECKDILNYVLLSVDQIDFLQFLQERGYTDYDFYFRIVEKLNIKEF